MIEFVPFIAAVALIAKLVDFAKFLRNGDVNAIVTQAATWGAGIGVIFLLAASDYAEGLDVGGKLLGNLNGASLVLIGVSIASTGSLLFDAKKAFDTSDSARTPPLVGPDQPDA